MKILIVGLGIIGGAYAAGLAQKGHYIYGVDKNEETLNYAIANHYAHEVDKDAKKFIPLADLIIICLYPDSILNFLKENETLFLEHQVITDVCGVKSNFVYEAKKMCGKAEYLTHHPMAGREKIGIEYSTPSVFKDANFLICPFEDSTEKAINMLIELGNDLGFKRHKLMSPNHQDQMISYTSQLTHAIAVSLVNADHDDDTKYYIGDSYRDLTRIAMINETLWSELFLSNKDYLLAKICDFETELNLMKKALEHSSKEELEELFRQSTKKRKEIEK